MSWPLSQDYNEAVQSPARNFADPDLRRGAAATNALGLPMPHSGTFADVYEVRCPGGQRWAVKCFTREVPGLRQRYDAISSHLRQAKLPFTVDFSYLEEGIRVAGRWFPALKMQWVEGFTLNQFVGRAADKPAVLAALLHVWARMGRCLRAAGVGHCDLQHGNVLLVPGTGGASLALRLVDYDGMWVPALAGSASGEAGHPSYQHPRRAREATYSLEVDRFPLLLVATALRALTASGRPLWERYDNGDNLLFSEADLLSPSKSRLFLELIRSEDAAAAMANALVDALRGGVESAPLLEELMPEAKPAPPVRIAPAARQSRDDRDEPEESADPVVTIPAGGRRQRTATFPVSAAVAAVATVLVTVAVVTAFVLTRGDGKAGAPTGEALAQNRPDSGRTRAETVFTIPHAPPATLGAGSHPESKAPPSDGAGTAPAKPAPEKALQFKGKAYVELEKTRGLLDLNGTFSAEMWVRLSPSLTNAYLVGDEAWSGMSPQVPVSAACGWVLRTAEFERDGLRRLDFTIGSTAKGNEWVSVIGKSRLDDDRWYHVAVSKTPDAIKVFLDGKLEASRGCKGMRFSASPTNLFLGVRKHPWTNRFFYGTIRAFHLSSSARFQRDFSPEKRFRQDKDTIISLDFSLGRGDRIPDLSGANHHGTIVGAEWTEVKEAK